MLGNVMMELRKCCNHAFLIKGVEDGTCQQPGPLGGLQKLLAASGKLALLDSMLVKLQAQGHRTLIYSQFTMVPTSSELLFGSSFRSGCHSGFVPWSFSLVRPLLDLPCLSSSTHSPPVSLHEHDDVPPTLPCMYLHLPVLGLSRL